MSATETIKFNADAKQQFTFEVTDDDATYEITQVFSDLQDKILEQFDKLREVSLETSGKVTDMQTNSVVADEYLFDELCIDVLGYDGEKPENWKEMIPYDEKKAGIGKLLAVKIVSDDKEKVVTKRSWDKPVLSGTVELKSYFSGELVKTKAFFERKTPADLAAYSVIKNRVSLLERGLDDSAIKIPASMKRKADLFDKMDPKTDGYDGRVPLHHKAAFITGLFEPRISSTEKK